MAYECHTSGSRIVSKSSFEEEGAGSSVEEEEDVAAKPARSKVATAGFSRVLSLDVATSKLFARVTTTIEGSLLERSCVTAMDGDWTIVPNWFISACNSHDRDRHRQCATHTHTHGRGDDCRDITMRPNGDKGSHIGGVG